MRQRSPRDMFEASGTPGGGPPPQIHELALSKAALRPDSGQWLREQTRFWIGVSGGSKEFVAVDGPSRAMSQRLATIPDERVQLSGGSSMTCSSRVQYPTDAGDQSRLVNLDELAALLRDDVLDPIRAAREFSLKIEPRFVAS